MFQIITFDDYGVSGHSNHISVHKGVRRYLARRQADASSRGPVAGFCLESTSLLRKYSGPIDVAVSQCLFPPERPSFPVPSQVQRQGSDPGPGRGDSSGPGSSVLSIPSLFWTADPLVSYRAMQAHASQWVWFRKLFVFFSRYSFVNTLHVLPPE